MLAILCLWAGPSWACERGSVCWTDLSGGQAETDLRFRADGWERTVTVGKGRTAFAFGDLLRANRVASDWLCVQGRQRAADGTRSAWYLSEHEGVCKPMAAVLPPEPEPDTPPPADSFGIVSQSGTRLSIEYPVADCPRGVQQTTSAIKDGRRTITLTCRQ